MARRAFAARGGILIPGDRLLVIVIDDLRAAVGVDGDDQDCIDDQRHAQEGEDHGRVANMRGDGHHWEPPEGPMRLKRTCSTRPSSARTSKRAGALPPTKASRGTITKVPTRVWWPFCREIGVAPMMRISAPAGSSTSISTRLSCWRSCRRKRRLLPMPSPMGI